MIDRRELAYQEFGAFLTDFVRDLNHRAEEGWSVLVEGARDENALRALGYSGPLATVSEYARKRAASFRGAKGVVILTDLDREGALLAAKFIKRLQHERIPPSLSERRALRAESRGIFLHIENLSRFAPHDVGHPARVGDVGPAGAPTGPRHEGVGRRRGRSAG